MAWIARYEQASGNALALNQRVKVYEKLEAAGGELHYLAVDVDGTAKYDVEIELDGVISLFNLTDFRATFRSGDMGPVFPCNGNSQTFVFCPAFPMRWNQSMRVWVTSRNGNREMNGLLIGYSCGA